MVLKHLYNPSKIQYHRKLWKVCYNTFSGKKYFGVENVIIEKNLWEKINKINSICFKNQDEYNDASVEGSKGQ